MFTAVEWKYSIIARHLFRKYDFFLIDSSILVDSSMFLEICEAGWALIREWAVITENTVHFQCRTDVSENLTHMAKLEFCISYILGFAIEYQPGR